MRQSSSNTILSQCPICGRGEIVLQSRRGLGRARQRILPCPTCGAQLTPAGPGRFRLSYCAPQNVGPNGCRRCAGYVYSTCFLNRPLPVSDWARMANRMPPVEVEAFRETSKRFESGELPAIEVPGLSPQLAPDEVVHHASHPVFVGDWYLSSVSDAGGWLFVTDRRILFCTENSCSSFPFADVAEVEREHPGFFVRLREEQEPAYFYPPTLDPVFSAILGSLKNFRKKAQTA